MTQFVINKGTDALKTDVNYNRYPVSPLGNLGRRQRYPSAYIIANPLALSQESAYSFQEQPTTVSTSQAREQCLMLDNSCSV